MKYKTRLFTFLLLAILGLSIPPILAQGNADAANVTMHIDFISWGEDIPGLEVRHGNRSIPAQALAFRYSEPIEYSGPRILALALGQGDDKAAKEKSEAFEAWRLSQEAEGIDMPEAQLAPKEVLKVVAGEIPKALEEARKKDPSLAALVKLPNNSRRVTILLAPGPNRSLMPHVFDDDPARQPAGMVRVHNFSSYPILLTTSDGKTRGLKPGRNFLASAPKGTFAYELAYEINGVVKIQENNLVNVRPVELMHMVVLRSGSSFFSSSDGSRGGFMQTALLRRNAE